MHFESIEYVLTYPNSIALLTSCGFVSGGGPKMSKMFNYLIRSLKEFTKTPVVPIELFNIETSAHDDDSFVCPVH